MIKVTKDDFSVDEVLRGMSTKSTGALVSFVGVVRSQPDDVSALDLEVFEDMAAGQLEDIRAKAMERFRLEEVVIIHRYGLLKPGDYIVLVAVASAHRQEGFRAIEHIMNEIKRAVPIWKKESIPSGERWVEGER